MKSHIHYYCDNTFWSGAEQMLTCLFTSKLMQKEFRLTFSYREMEGFREEMDRWLTMANPEDSLFPLGIPPFYPLRLFSSEFYGKWYRFLKYLSIPFDAINMKRLFKKIKPDILHINNGGYPGAIGCNAAVLAGRLAGIPKIVYSVNNLPKKRGLTQRMIEKPMDKFVGKNVEVFMSGSEVVSGEMQELFHGHARHRAIPSTIHYHPLVKRSRIRNDLGLSEEDVLICSVGVFEERKGHKYLIEAFDNLVNGGGFVLLLVGRGEKEKEYIKQSKKFLRIRRDVKNSYSYINACDIYVQPSISHEDFPVSILQAMKLGKPIIASDVAGISEQVFSMHNGFIVEPGHVDQLKTYLSALLHRKETREKMGQNSKKRFERLYDYEKIMKEYKEFYECLIESR